MTDRVNTKPELQQCMVQSECTLLYESYFVCSPDMPNNCSMLFTQLPSMTLHGVQYDHGAIVLYI